MARAGRKGSCFSSIHLRQFEHRSCGASFVGKGKYVNNAFLRLLSRFQMLTMREDGQDLVEYALLTGLLAAAAVATVRTTATSVAHVFTNISTTLNAA